ncbi:MAG: hypothetical protein LBG57_10220, partial [Treponema sp.]|nr:hypothetical protein [Treponema sp.]
MKSFGLTLMRALLLVPVLLAPVSVWPQSADELEALMDAPVLTYDEAARFVLEAADTPSPPE